MWILSDEALFYAYVKAKELDLDACFIQQLEQELKKRSVNLCPAR